eukprot:2884669-Prymnesium_polylepis.1
MRSRSARARRLPPRSEAWICAAARPRGEEETHRHCTPNRPLMLQPHRRCSSQRSEGPSTA